jgi:hypothetical protein
MEQKQYKQSLKNVQGTIGDKNVIIWINNRCVDSSKESGPEP